MKKKKSTKKQGANYLGVGELTRKDFENKFEPYKAANHSPAGQAVDPKKAQKGSKWAAMKSRAAASNNHSAEQLDKSKDTMHLAVNPTGHHGRDGALSNRSIRDSAQAIILGTMPSAH